MDTERPDDDSPYEPVEVSTSVEDTVYAEPTAAPVAAPRSRIVLATLAGLVLTLVGIVAWPLLYMVADRDFPGITVVFALVIGYVVREVSRRSDLLPCIVSALLTAGMILVGNIAVVSAKTVDVAAEQNFEVSFWDVFKDLFPDETFRQIQNHRAITLVIFGAAVVVAFFSATKPKPKNAPAAPAAPVATDEPVPPAE